MFYMQGSDPSTSTVTFAVVMATTGRIPSPERQEKRPYQKEAREVNSTCTSSSGCIHYEFVDGRVQVEYIPAHTSRYNFIDSAISLVVVQLCIALISYI